VISLVARDQHSLGLEERPERAQAVRAQRAAARDEIDDRLCEAEPRRDLDGAGHVDELDRDSSSRENLARETRIRGRNVYARELFELGDRRLLGHGGFQPATAEAELQQLRDVGSALTHEVRASDAAVDDAVLDVLGHIGSAHEQDIDRRISAGKRERARSRLLRPEPRVVE
jgi:hypothetical protein